MFLAVTAWVVVKEQGIGDTSSVALVLVSHIGEVNPPWGLPSSVRQALDSTQMMAWLGNAITSCVAASGSASKK